MYIFINSLFPLDTNILYNESNNHLQYFESSINGFARIIDLEHNNNFKKAPTDVASVKVCFLCSICCDAEVFVRWTLVDVEV